MILLAVSGGIDSMCMADMFYRHTLPVRPVSTGFAVAHCNFHLRGEESDSDEKLVRRWCEERGIRLHCRDFDTEAFAREHGISVEMAARDLRYSWFLELCCTEGYEAAAIAHNANDNAETLILNLLRGTGGRGIRGMQVFREASGKQPALFRPLLGMSRDEICRYAEENEVPFREDRTNFDIKFKRNRIRHNVFPEFKALNPSFLRTFSNEMEHFAQENDIAQDWYLSVRDGIFDGERVDTGKLLALKHWKYALYRLTGEFGFDEATLGNIVRTITDGGPASGKCFFSDAYRIVTAPGKLIVGKRCQVPDSHLVIKAPGKYGYAGRTFTFSETAPASISPRQPSGTLVADAGKLKFPFILRRWRDGDWMRPLGMHGRKKLSDLFVDLKWSIPEKENAVVITAQDSESHVLALLCERIDDSLKIKEDTTEILLIESNSTEQ